MSETKWWDVTFNARWGSTGTGIGRITILVSAENESLAVFKATNDLRLLSCAVDVDRVTAVAHGL